MSLFTFNPNANTSSDSAYTTTLDFNDFYWEDLNTTSTLLYPDTSFDWGYPVTITLAGRRQLSQPEILVYYER